MTQDRDRETNALQPRPGRTIATIGGGEVEEAARTDVRQFITFRIEAEEYGIDILAVREIIAWTEVTRLPNMPKHVRGVLNLRGVILPVFDLRCRFGMGLTETTETHVIIIVAVHERLIGILVDMVSEILNMDPAEIRPVPDMELIVGTEYLVGLAAMEQRMVALLDADQLFDAGEMMMVAQQAGSGG